MHFLYFIFFLVVVLLELFRKKEELFDFFTVFNVFFCFGYILQGLMLNWDATFLHQAYIPLLGEDIYYNNISGFLTILVSYILIYITFFRVSRVKKFASQLKIKPRFYKFDNVLLAFWICIFLIAFCLYTYSYGGYFKALGLANLLRQGKTAVSSFSFMKPLFYSGTLICILLASRVTKIFSQRTLMLVLMFSFSIAALALISGRANMVLLIVFTGFALVKGKVKIVPLAIIGISFYFIMVYGDALFALSYYLEDGGSISDLLAEQEVGETAFFKRLLMEFQYPYASLHVSLYKVSLNELRFFIDVPIGMINILPDKVVGFSPPESVAYLNTYNVAGVWQSTIPPGIIAFFIYSFHYLGLLIGPIIYGSLGGALQAFIQSNRATVPWINGLYLYICYEWSGFTISGEPRVDFTAFFVLNFSLLLIFFRLFLLPKLLNK